MGAPQLPMLPTQQQLLPALQQFQLSPLLQSFLAVTAVATVTAIRLLELAFVQVDGQEATVIRS
jgi:hypothetical protein